MMAGYVRKSKAIIIAVIVGAVVIIIVAADKYVPKVIMKYYCTSFKSAETADGIQFEQIVRDGTYRMIDDESWGTKPFANKTSLIKVIRLRPAHPISEYGEYALLMHYAFMYGMQRDDSDMLALIRSKFDKYYRMNKTPIVRADQIAYGNVALDLWRYTNDAFYLSFAESLFMRLDSIEKVNGKVLYRDNSITQEVDAIGLVCPFLVNYGLECRNERAITLAAQMVADYIRWGTDAVTGIPVQTYVYATHVKCNKANWGRGIGWYLEGVNAVMSVDTLSYPVLKEYIYMENLPDRVDLLYKTLLSDADHLYPQYYNQGNTPDMSATIPILFYTRSIDEHQMTKDELASLVSPYFDSDGIVRFCSPSISYPQKTVNQTYTNLWVQGMALMLCSMCQ